MPKVLRIINRFNLGGPTYNAGILSRHLPPSFETKLIGGAIDSSEAQSFHILDELQVKYEIIPEMKRSLQPIHDFRAFLKIRKLIKKFKPDIVHTHASKAGTAGRLAAFSCNVPVVVHTFHGHVFHSYFGKLKTHLFLSIERFLAKRSAAIIAISPKQKQELAEEFRICNPEKIHVIPLGFDLSRFQTNLSDKRINFRDSYNVDADAIAIGIIGRLVPIKNHRMFIKAIHRVLNSVTANLRFFIVGDGESRDELWDLANDLNIAVRYKSEGPIPVKGIEFTSWITDVDRVLAGLDIVCLTSYNEGTPVSLIEAQAVGRAIVSTRVGGVEDVVRENETALLCKSDDFETFANLIVQLIENDQTRERLAMNGPDKVEERYGYKRLVHEITGLYLDKLKIHTEIQTG